MGYAWGSDSYKYAYTYKTGTGEQDEINYITLPDGTQLSNTQDGFKRITEKKIELGNDSLTSTYSYLNGIGNYTTILVESATLLDGTTLHYTYDEVGNITSVTKNNENQPYATYEYDELNQLVRENRSDLGVTYVFTYDKAGNILTKSSCAYTTGEPTNLTTVAYGYQQGDWKDQLTSFDGHTITYDAISNPGTYYNGMKFTWRDGRRLTHAEVDDDRTLDIQYDAEGLIYKKTLTETVNTDVYREITEYNYNSSTLVGIQVSKYLNSDTPSESYRIWFIYDEIGDLIGLQKGDDVYYYSKNIAGDVLALVEQDGTVVARYNYDAWGKIVSITDGSNNDVSSNAGHIANLNPMRYRGYYYDKDLGLYYLQSRYYDANTGRFINADGYVSTGIGLLSQNMFAYCLNNPVLYIDLTGTRPGVHYFPNGLVGYTDTGTGKISKPALLNDSVISDNDFRKLVKNGGKVTPNVTQDLGYNVTRTIKSVEYVPSNQTKDYYIDKLESTSGFSSWSSASVATSLTLTIIKKVAKYEVPYIGEIFLVGDCISLWDDFCERVDRERYKDAMDKGEGVLIIEWEMSGSRVVSTEFVEYHSWQGR